MGILKIFSISVCGLLFISYSPFSHALWCTNGVQTVQYTAVGSITGAVIPVSINKNTLDTVISDMATYASCNGSTLPAWKDALQATDISLSSKLTNLGFVGYIDNGNKHYSPLSTSGVCVWPDNQCSVLGLPNDTTLPLMLKVGMSRTLNSGDWNAGVAISAGELIATLSTRYRYSGAAYSSSFNWYFVAQNDAAIPAYTCSVTQFDSSVTLPSVKRSDLVSHGTGRFPGVNKEFKFNLNCDPQTAVYVTYEGDILSGTGTDQVLENKRSGNPNVGIQLLMNNTIPVKFAEKFLVSANAQATEVLKFNAYYYYKGGDVSGGGIKSQTTFLFDYQ